MKVVSGQLELCGLEVRCIIGDRPEERVREQMLSLDVVLAMDLSKVVASDALQDTVDYAKLAEEIRTALRKAQFKMIEAAAECAAQVCLRHTLVETVTVRVEKAGAVPGLRAAAVTLECNKGVA